MKFKKEKQVEKLNIGCGTCSPVTQVLKMDRLLAVGFGDCSVTKNGDIVYSEQQNKDEDFPIAKKYEEIAKKDPGNDWRINFHAPLYDQAYQRQGTDYWVCIESGNGFA